MKHVYLLMTLALGFSTAAFAQRSVDMALIPIYPAGGVVLVSENETPAMQEWASRQNNVNFEFKNLGLDDILIDDTLILGSPLFNEYMHIGAISGISVSSSAFWGGHNLVLTYEATGVTSSQTTTRIVCDTLWVVDINGDVVFDPDLSNNHNCTNVTFDVWFLDVADVNKVNGFSLFPNPAATQLNVVSTFNNAKVANVVIRDIVGKTVFTQNLGTNLNGQQTFALDISNFVTGMYVIELNVDGNRTTRQIQVRK